MLSRYQEAFSDLNRDIRLLILTTGAAAFGWGITDLLTNLYVLRAGYGERTVGLLVSIGALVMAGTALPLGVMVDRHSRRAALWLGVALSAAGTVAIALAPSEPFLYLGAAIGGVSAALLTVAVPAFISEHAGPHVRAYAFTLMSVVYLLLATFGQLGGGFLPSLLGGGAAGYRYALLLGACVLLLAAGGRLRLRDATAEDGTRRGELGRIVHWPVVLHSAGSNLLLGTGAGLFIPFFNVIYRVRYGLDPASIGWIFSVQSILMLLAVILAPLLSERRGTVNTVTAGWGLSIVFLMLMGWAPDPYWFTATFWVRGMLMFAIGPLLDSFRQGLLSGGERATASSLFGMTWFVGWAVGAAAGGELLARGLYAAPFVVSMLFYVGSGLWFYMAFRHVETRVTA
ncbi:MAG: MFS transporter [bacterium]|nr:MFS transporter [bacterium]